MNFGEIDFYLVFDLFILLLIGMGPKIALVPFLDMTADMDSETKKKVASTMVRAAVGTGPHPGRAWRLFDEAPALLARSGIHRRWDRTASHRAQHARQPGKRAFA